MRIRLAALTLLAAMHTAAAQDDYKVIKLEQDVRNLERQVQDLSRQVSDTQRQLAQWGGRPASRAGHATPAAGTSASWLDVSNWDRLREGMTELQVIELLGPPTSMRAESDSRTLFYAMEIGSNGFLSGSVRLVDRKVEDVEKPVLR
jgi:hypothetical protein